MLLQQRTQSLQQEAQRLLAAGDHLQASRRLQQLLEIWPDNPGNHYRYAVCLLSLGQIDKAEYHARTASKLAPQRQEPKIMLESIQQLRSSPDQ